MKTRSGLLIVCALAVAGSVFGQTPAPAQSLPPQQLDNLVAPIAIYPDPLLGQVLAASTYPVELMEAHQWLEANRNLTGQQRMDAAQQQNWDPSVQALVSMPDVMDFLTQDIRWTTDLGNAFLAQQEDVMSAVQRMRQRAQANGRLRSSPQESVTTANDNGQQAIEIQPANPDVMYVPAYDPYYVYGYGAYPPLSYPDGYWFEPGIDMGLYFGGWGGWGFGGGWGWGPNWFGRTVFVNTVFFNRYGFRNGRGFGGGFNGRMNWSHDPVHRMGAVYPNGALTSRFGAASQASRMAAGRSGNWRSFGEGNVAARNSFRGVAPQAGRFSGNPQRFSGNAQRFSGNAQRFQQTPARNFQTPQPQRNFQAPQRNVAPQRNFQTPQRNFRAAPTQQSAPAPAFRQAAPRMSAPSNFGGGGARSFGGGGGSRSAAGGGSRNSGGGHGHR